MSKYLNKIIVMLMTCCLVMNNNLVLCAHSYKTKEVLATSSNLKMDTIDEEEQIIYDCISYIND